MKIKICGLFRPCDADYVNAAPPDYAGFVFYPPSHRFVTDNTAETLRYGIDKRIETVGVFVNESIEHIERLYQKGIINIIQLHGRENNEYIERLRQKLSKAEIWQAFAIRNEQDLKNAENSTADKILLDNGYGTGKCFDWSLVSGFDRDFILAGGITPENVNEAIARFSPWCIDVSSGVETDKVKDKKKIAEIVNKVKNRE